MGGDEDVEYGETQEMLEQLVVFPLEEKLSVAHPHLNATHVFLPSTMKDGLWLTCTSKQYIKDNFHIRYIQRDKTLEYLTLFKDYMVVSRSSSAAENLEEKRDALMVNVTDEVIGEKKSVPGYIPESPEDTTQHIYFIAHNCFGYLSHLNTLPLRFTKQGFSSRGLADERAFNDMMSNLYSTQFMDSLVVLEHWQEGAFRLPPKPPDPPASILYSSAQMSTYYAVLSGGHAEVITVRRDEDGNFVREYEQLPGPLSDNSTDQEVSKSYRRMPMKFHPDRNFRSGNVIDPKDKFKTPMINDANDKVTEWRARGSAAAPGGVALMTMKMARSNTTFYCSYPSNICTFNRERPNYKPGAGGVKPRYEKGGVDPYMNADIAPPVVCAQCAAAGFRIC